MKAILSQFSSTFTHQGDSVPLSPSARSEKQLHLNPKDAKKRREEWRKRRVDQRSRAVRPAVHLLNVSASHRVESSRATCAKDDMP